MNDYKTANNLTAYSQLILYNLKEMHHNKKLKFRLLLRKHRSEISDRLKNRKETPWEKPIIMGTRGCRFVPWSFYNFKKRVNNMESNTLLNWSREGPCDVIIIINGWDVTGNSENGLSICQTRICLCHHRKHYRRHGEKHLFWFLCLRFFLSLLNGVRYSDYVLCFITTT